MYIANRHEQGPANCPDSGPQSGAGRGKDVLVVRNSEKYSNKLLFFLQVEYLVKTKRRTRRDQDIDKENEGVWVKEHQIKNHKRIDRYDEQVIKDRHIQQIVGATPTKKSIWFYVQWVSGMDDPQASGAWLSSQILKEKFPQELIKFYESHLTVGN